MQAKTASFALYHQLACMDVSVLIINLQYSLLKCDVNKANLFIFLLPKMHGSSCNNIMKLYAMYGRMLTHRINN